MSQSAQFKLPDTGQIHCYDRDGQEVKPQPGEALYGQNGNFVINPFSFTKLGAGGNALPEAATWADGWRMVRDNNTGLVWETKSPQVGEVNDCRDKYTWLDAQTAYVEKLNAQKYGGFSDWRMPNKDELRSVMDYSRANPALDPFYFPDCPIGAYWCSATYNMQPYFGWAIFTGLGSGIAASKTHPAYVMAVRGGYQPLFGRPDRSRFVDNGDGTITDSATGLMWQKGENERMSWFEALEHCQQMKLAGHADWRLPNLKELNTILNLNFDDGWWYFRDFFPAEGLKPPLLHYFSSSVFEKTFAWVTNFCFGYDGYYANKDARLLFRAVRNVEPPLKEPAQFKLPDSGQTQCYDDEGNLLVTPKKGERFFGQDGTFSLHPMDYGCLREGGIETGEALTWEQGLRMVFDKNTGLTWEVKSPHRCDVNTQTGRYNWKDARLYIDRLNAQAYGGFADWRLPNREELRTIVNYDGRVPAVNGKFFGAVQPDFYWSKDVYGADPKLIWGIYFPYGCGICYFKENLYRAMGVRGGYNPAFGDTTRYAFKDNGDGTVTDLNTHLMWMKEESPELNQVEALKFCAELRLGGYADWRMPNIKEIATLLKLSFTDSIWFDRDLFPNVKTKPQGFYAASSVFAATFGWGVNFQFGYDGYYADRKSGHYPFRPVRSLNT